MCGEVATLSMPVLPGSSLEPRLRAIAQPEVEGLVEDLSDFKDDMRMRRGLGWGSQLVTETIRMPSSTIEDDGEERGFG